ncbi:MAG: hypothetical protein KBT08_03015 [Bacteroidales bacterium]|nr:hypothetical protein [Candidatus Cryptobacteroides onthequi]
MRRLKIILPILISIIIVAACDGKKKELRTMMHSFCGETFSLPKSFTCIESGKIISCSVPDSELLFIMYIGPGECTSCVLSHLQEEKGILELCDSLGRIVPIFLFCPYDEDEADVVRMILDADYDFPVYIDHENVLNTSGQVPNDRRFHGFMLGFDRHPIYVGNPNMSPRMKGLFVDAVKHEIDNNIHSLQ